MPIRIDALSVDASDPGALARWWSEALGWPLTVDDGDEVALAPPEDERDGAVLPEILFVKAPDEKVIKNRLHLDLRPDDQAAEVARLEALGARRVDIGQGEQTWIVLSDPEGNEFCVLSSRAS